MQLASIFSMQMELTRKTTWMWRILIFIAAVYFIFFAGCKAEESDGSLPFRTTVISANQLPTLDPTRTYHYTFTLLDPDVVLRGLLQSGIPVSRAWLPLNNSCLDPIGPRFTVELTTADQRIESQNFERGEGRLACSSQFRQYERTR